MRTDTQGHPSRRGAAYTRRSLLRAAGGAAAFASVALHGVPSAWAQAAPSNAHHPIVLWWLADTSLPSNKVGFSILNEATAPFVATHKGITLRPGFMIGNGIIPQMVSGDGPDVISDWNAAPYWAGNLLLPLDSYMRRDNINPSVWSAGQWSVMQQPFGTFMLPAYFSPMVYLVRLSDFDELGLEYPNPNWTYTEYVDIARKLTIHTAKKTRYGTDVEFHHTRIGGESWLFKAFGGDLMNAEGTVQTLSSPGSVAGGQWVFEKLFWPQIGCYRDQFWGNTGIDGLLNDQQAMRVIWGNGLLMAAASNIRDQFKWAIYPAPVFPKGRMTQGTEDFYGINAQTRHPDEAWELLKYLSYDSTFTRFLMGVDAQTPALIGLWSEWQSVVESMAPPLRGKGLQWFSDAALKGYGMPGEYFRYGDAQVKAIDSPWITKLWNHQVDVVEAFHSADQQANAFLSEAAAVAKEQTAITSLLAQGAKGPVTFPAPPVSGPLGIPGNRVTGMVSVKDGTYTVQGAGQGLNTAGADGVFFCTRSTASRATFACRITAIANVNAPAMADGAKIGLMARGDLTDQAAAAGVVVAMGRGVHAFAQSVPGGGYSDEGGWRAGKVGGLVPASLFLHPDSTKQANYLLKPIWLRLVRNDRTWVAFSSLDGTHWTQATPSLGMNAAGVWIGLFVTAHDSKLGVTGKRIKATFDHVSGFVPQTEYRLGNP